MFNVFRRFHCFDFGIFVFSYQYISFDNQTNFYLFCFAADLICEKRVLLSFVTLSLVNIFPFGQLLLKMSAVNFAV